MPRLKLTIAYVGTRYCGWQIQEGRTATQPTVQAALEKAAARIACEPVHIHGSGRTDAGVHAEAQVAHMDVPPHRAGANWQRALNTYLPPDIRVICVENVPDTFHAQFDAVRKTYHYRLWHATAYTPPQLYPFVWECGPVDTNLMDAAARHFIGCYDCAALQNTGTPLEHTIRTVFTARRETACNQDESLWVFEADGFLKQMVRNMMGLLVHVGRGKCPPEQVAHILASKQRSQAAVTAPAKGLGLHAVHY